jgi:hypothetical protein
MKATPLLRLCEVALVAGIVLGICTIFLPGVKSPQTLTAEGPVYAYDGTDYAISGYLIPPVDAGQKIQMNLSGYKPNSMSVSLFPSRDNTVSPSGTPLVFISNVPWPTFFAQTAAPATQYYGIYVSSTNHTAFRITVSSVWSPYYILGAYVSESAFLLILGGLGTAYFTGVRKREKEYERVVSEVASRRREPPSGSGS